MKWASRASSCLSMRFSWCYRRVTAIGVLGAASIVSMGATGAPPSSSQATASAEVVRSTKSIPRDHYQTWSLFLVCNPKWLVSNMSHDLYWLYEQFESFGRTIGDDNLAVWFWKKDKNAHDPDLAGNVDVERSIRFCKSFKLAPSAGPHLLIVTRYPKVTKEPGDHADFALGSMSPREIADLLGELTDELLLEGKVTSKPTAAVGSKPAVSATAKPAADAAPPQDGLWIRLLEATRHNLNSFGCAWTFKVNAGSVATELRPCQKAQ